LLQPSPSGNVEASSVRCGRQGSVPLPLVMAWGVLPPPASNGNASDR
jgi:hypothetical protein